MTKNITVRMCEKTKCTVMLVDGGKYPNVLRVDILQGVAQGCTLSLNVFQINIDDMIAAAVEPAKKARSHEMGEDTVSGLMFADDFVLVSETPEGLQERIENALEYALGHGE